MCDCLRGGFDAYKISQSINLIKKVAKRYDLGSNKTTY